MKNVKFLALTLMVALLSNCGLQIRNPVGGAAANTDQQPNTAGNAEPLYTVGGTVTGLPDGTEVEVKIDGKSVYLDQNGPFVLPPEFISGEDYDVSLETATVEIPEVYMGNTYMIVYACSINNQDGTIVDADITNVKIECVKDSYYGPVAPGTGGTGHPHSGHHGGHGGHHGGHGGC
jgi:hypothetical protein